MDENEKRVEQRRVTLVDNKNKEYEFVILDEYELNGKNYMALVSAEEKGENGSEKDPEEMNDITVVRKVSEGETFYFEPVNDADELYAVSKLISRDYGHLMEGE